MWGEYGEGFLGGGGGGGGEFISLGWGGVHPFEGEASPADDNSLYYRTK